MQEQHNHSREPQQQTAAVEPQPKPEETPKKLSPTIWRSKSKKKNYFGKTKAELDARKANRKAAS